MIITFMGTRICTIDFLSETMEAKGNGITSLQHQKKNEL